MGRAGCIVLALVVLLFGYDQWRIEQMRRELRAISGKVHIEQSPSAKDEKTDLVTALAQVEKHTVRAKELIRKKRTTEAQAELDRALKSLNAANSVSEDIVGDAAGYLGKQRDRAIQVFRKAWQDISREAKPKKVDVERK